MEEILSSAWIGRTDEESNFYELTGIKKNHTASYKLTLSVTMRALIIKNLFGELKVKYTILHNNMSLELRAS